MMANKESEPNQWRVSKTERILLHALERVYGGRIIVQAKIARYHVDIFLPELGVGVEVDGPWHLTDEVTCMDSMRDEELHSLGYTVVRIPCEQVREDPHAAALYALQGRKKQDQLC